MSNAGLTDVLRIAVYMVSLVGCYVVHDIRYAN